MKKILIGKNEFDFKNMKLYNFEKKIVSVENILTSERMQARF